MNVPFKKPPTETILADACVGISELKKNPSAVIAVAQEQQVAILNRNKPVAYLISPEVWEYLDDLLDEIQLADIIEERLAERDDAVEVTLEELSAGFPEEGDEGVE